MVVRLSVLNRARIVPQIALILIAMFVTSFALAADPVYTAEVRVKSQSAADTQNGMARALIQVLERVSGDPNVKSRPYLGPELKNAKALSISHDFVQKEGRSAAGVPSFGTNIVVQFDPNKVRALVKRSGLQYWPEPRQQPLAWIVVDDGQHGPRLVSYTERDAARSLLERGQMRGIQVVLPKGNAAEKALAGAVVRKDLRALSVASAAYKGDSQLVGYIKRVGDEWEGRWTFIERGKILKDWDTKNKDPFEVVAAGGDGAADALIRRYAVAGFAPKPPPMTEEELAALETQKAAQAAAVAEGTGGDDPSLAGAPNVSTTSVVRETFNNVSNSADYMSVMGKLNQIPGVKSVTTVATTQGGVVVDITYVGDPSALKAAIALQGLHSGGSKVIQQSSPPAQEPPKQEAPKVEPAPAKVEPAPAKSAEPAKVEPAPAKTPSNANNG